MPEKKSVFSPSELPEEVKPDAHEYKTIVCSNCLGTHRIPMPCGDRFCAVCNTRRRKVARAKITGVMDKLPRTKAYVFRHITLSVANCSDLKSGIKFLTDSFRRLRQRSYWKNRVSGGVFTVEVTGKPDNWHPHLHILVYTRGMSWTQLSKRWNHVSGGLSCYIQNMPPGKAVIYMTKYITKASVPDHLIKTVSALMKGIRLFQFFGDWHGLAAGIKIPKFHCPTCGAARWEIIDFTVYEKPINAMSAMIGKLNPHLPLNKSSPQEPVIEHTLHIMSS